MRHSHDGSSKVGAPIRPQRSQSLGPHHGAGRGGHGSALSNIRPLPGDGSGSGGGVLAGHDMEALIEYRMAALRDSGRRQQQQQQQQQRSSFSPMEPLWRSAGVSGTGRTLSAGSGGTGTWAGISGGGTSGKGGAAASVEYAAVRREIEREREAMSRRTQQQLRQLEGNNGLGGGSGSNGALPVPDGGDVSEASQEEERYSSSFGSAASEGGKGRDDSLEAIRPRREEGPRRARHPSGNATKGGKGPSSAPDECARDSPLDEVDYMMDEEDLGEEGEESLYLAESLAQELQESVGPLAAAGRPLKTAALSSAPAEVSGRSGSDVTDDDGGNYRSHGDARGSESPVGRDDNEGDESEASSGDIPDEVDDDSGYSSLAGRSSVVEEEGLNEGYSALDRSDQDMSGPVRDGVPEETQSIASVDEILEEGRMPENDRSSSRYGDDEGYDSDGFDSASSEGNTADEIGEALENASFIEGVNPGQEGGSSLQRRPEITKVDKLLAPQTVASTAAAPRLGISTDDDANSRPDAEHIQESSEASSSDKEDASKGEVSSLGASGDLRPPAVLHSPPAESASVNAETGTEQAGRADDGVGESEGAIVHRPASTGSLASMEAAVARRRGKVEEVRGKLKELQGTRARVRAKRALAEELDVLEVSKACCATGWSGCFA